MGKDGDKENVVDLIVAGTGLQAWNWSFGGFFEASTLAECNDIYVWHLICPLILWPFGVQSFLNDFFGVLFTGFEALNSCCWTVHIAFILEDESGAIMQVLYQALMPVLIQSLDESFNK